MRDETIASFLTRLAARSAAPGGGATGALHAAQAAALLALGASCAVLSSVLGDTAAVAAGMAVFGAAEAVTGITLTALIQHAAPPGARTESYSVIISAALAGTAAGSLAGGALTGGAGVRLALTVAAGGAVAAAAWAAFRHDTLGKEEQNP